MVIFGFENNGRRQWCSRGGTWNARERRSKNIKITDFLPVLSTDLYIYI